VYSFRAAVAQAFPAAGTDGCAKAGVTMSNALAATKLAPNHGDSVRSGVCTGLHRKICAYGNPMQ
jgi:hypothetical protein